MICKTISTKCQESNEDPYWNFIKFYQCLFSSPIRKIHSDLLYNPLLVSYANIYIYIDFMYMGLLLFICKCSLCEKAIEQT